jgi:hypothetical protein
MGCSPLIFTGERQCREMASDALTDVKISMGCLLGYGTNANCSYGQQPWYSRDTTEGFEPKCRQDVKEAKGPDQVMLPGMKQRIEIPNAPLIGQTIVLPTRFGSVITASSGTSIHSLSMRTR